MLGIGAVPSALLALMVFGMPESPRWLVMKGRLADARAVLAKTSDTPEEAVERLDQIKAAAGIPRELDGDVVVMPKTKGGQEKQVWKELIFSPTPAMRRILLAALGIHFFQQATGSDSVVLYSPRVFQSAGITGRRPLLLTSTAGMLACLIGLGTGLTVVGRHPDAKVPWAIGLCIVSILAYVSFFSIGLGPLTSVYTSEVFPLRVRALGFALGASCNRVTSAAVSMSFLSLSKAITIGGSFFLYAGIAAIGWIFFFTFIPETRGLPLEEIGKLFGMTDTAVEAQDTATKDKAKVGEMN
uniref:Major facilitator superfamily (MFS) profile domain-containing protein n=1 Tax=Aegilops tauschii subsp. strangulata TaxID=200361 RepID=A0A453B7C5_AEGTS